MLGEYDQGQGSLTYTTLQASLHIGVGGIGKRVNILNPI